MFYINKVVGKVLYDLQNTPELIYRFATIPVRWQDDSHLNLCKDLW